jgi:glycosyltransferase involved in cell wall biosynthesis
LIPKIIHYCWFGGGIPEENNIYIQEWKKSHPGWEFIFWNEQNTPMYLPYMQKAYQEKNFSNMSNLLRLHALSEFGGIYLDTDIKMIKPLDSLCDNSCFFGFEEGDENSEEFWVNNAICGAEKNHLFIKELYIYLLESFDGGEQANLSSPHMTTDLLKKSRGLVKYGYQKLNDVTIYPKEFFYPIHYSEVYKLANLKDNIFPETIVVHVWARTWLSKETLLYIIDDLYRINHEMHSIKNIEIPDQSEIIYRLKKISSSQYFSKLFIENLLESIQKFEATVKDQHIQILQLSNQKSSLLGENHLLSKQLKESTQSDAATIEQLLQKEKDLSGQLLALISTVENQRSERKYLLEQIIALQQKKDGLQKNIDGLKLNAEQDGTNKNLLEKDIANLKIQLDEAKEEALLLRQEMEVKNARHKQEITEANNEIKSLRKAITWYQDTYEKRTVVAIIKDRIVQRLKNINTFANRLKGYHKIKKSKLKSEFQNNILCSIVNYNDTDNALKLRTDLSRYFDTVVFDSGSKKTSKKFINLGNVYYSGLINNAYTCAKALGYNYLFFICSDVEFPPEEIQKMIHSLKSIELNTIGIYSPSSKGRSHIFCKQKFNRGLRSVPFTEGFIFIADLKVLDEFMPVNLHENLYGWGLDLAKGYFSRKLDKLCVIDDAVSVYHPESTGYSNQKAEEDMWHWVNTFSDSDKEFKFFFDKHIDILRKGNADKLKVSVIIPCYNQGQFLRQTIYNILLQEYSYVEILIINDGSTDDTEQIARSLETQFPQVRYFSKKNGGLGNTRNYGIQKSTGGLIQFLDADDLLSKDKFLAQVCSILNKPEIEVSYSPYLCFEDGNDSNTWTYSRVMLEADPLADLIQNWEKDLSIPVHCFLFRKEVVDTIRFDEELPNHEDWLFHIYVAASRPFYHFENKGLAYYRVRTNSMARDKALMIKGKEMCINKAIHSGLFNNEYLQQLENRLEFSNVNA